MKAQDIEHYSGEELDVLSQTVHYQQWIAEQFQPYLRGKMMEIGAGTGTMAKRWIAYADELHLVEPARNLFPILRDAFHSNSKVSPHCGTLEHVLFEHPKLSVRAFDAVIMINVLEHIEDHARVLNLVNQMLTPGGYLLIFVPAMPSLYGSLDRRFGHYRRYTKAGLVSLCEQTGFEVNYVKYFDVFGAFPWWFVNRILRSTDMNPHMARIYDGLVVPIARRIEKLINPPFGKNLVLVGRMTGK